MPEHAIVHEADMVKIEIRGLEGHPMGEGMIPKDAALHRPLWVDGFSHLACTGYMRVTIDRETARIAGKPHMTGQVVGPIPTAVVILDVPDYPHEDGVSLVFSLADIEEIIPRLQHLVREGKRVEGFNQRQLLRDRAPQAERQLQERITNATRCAEPGCPRQRHAFVDGTGYCKRHARQKKIL